MDVQFIGNALIIRKYLGIIISHRSGIQIMRQAEYI